MIEALKTGALGMGITLISLYVLSLILDLMRVVFHRPDKKEKTPEILPARAREEEMEPQEETQEDEGELVAAITAALSVYLQKPADRIKIGFIRKIHERTPAWGMESRLNPME